MLKIQQCTHEDSQCYAETLMLSSETSLLLDAVDKALAGCVEVDPKATERVPFSEEVHKAQLQLGIFGLLSSSDEFGLTDALRIAAALAKHKAPWNFYGSTLADLALRLGADIPDFCKEQAAQGKIAWGYTGARGSGTFDIHTDGAASLERVPVLTGEQAQVSMVLCPWHGLVVLASENLSFKPCQTIDVTVDFGRLSGDCKPPQVARCGDAKLTRVLTAASALLLAADAVGAAQALLDKAIEYVCQREQFGRVVGTFQGVQHSAATMAASLAPCLPMLLQAGQSLMESGSDAAIAASWRARAHCAEVARIVVKGATELQGGIGFTAEWGTHLWYKRSVFSETLLGGGSHARRLAVELDPKYSALRAD